MPDPVQLDQSQMESLADMIASKMGTPAAPAAPAAPATPAAPVMPAGFDMEAFTASMTNALAANTATANNQIYDTLFKERMAANLEAVPGLAEFLNGKDDYQRVRMDELNKIESYEARNEALDNLTKSFQEASAGAPGRAPIINTKAREAVVASNAKYEDWQAKVDKGEFATIDEMSSSFLQILEAEAAQISS